MNWRNKVIFSADRWLGNKWASIEIEPVDEVYFLPMLSHLMTTYHVPQPTIIDSIDGYFAEFQLLNSKSILSIDAWTFSIAFEDEVVRDIVLEALVELPDNYFSSCI